VRCKRSKKKRRPSSFHGIRSYNFWRLMFNKVTSRSYSYFLKFSYLFWVEKWIPPGRSENTEIGKKTKKF
jgi:hypothetical protein